MFNPMKFQISVAAGGISLMPFVLLMYGVPHGPEGPITLATMPWEEMSRLQNLFFAPIVGIMFLFVVLHLFLTFVYLKGLMGLLMDREQFSAFINNPRAHIGIFSPIASLSMSANVVWGPLAFFVPGMAGVLSGLMIPSLFFFGALLLALLIAEGKVLKVWMTHPIDPSQLNFSWLLDIFAFGLVSLTGTGIAATSNDPFVASVAAFGSFFSVFIGLFLFFVKFTMLLYGQMKAESLPDTHVLPAKFLLIPISCLFGISLYRITEYLHTHFAVEVTLPSFLVLNFAFVAALGWFLFCIYLLADYLRNFLQQNYSPAQWGMV